MPLQKISLRPGCNRENTRYTNEGSYYESDKVRFRQGTPEKIGGWQRISATTFVGVCRALWAWFSLSSTALVAVGTNLKHYVLSGGTYNDITPLRVTRTLVNNPITTYNGLTTVTILDALGGQIAGDYVTFSGATAVGGLTISGEYQIMVSVVANSYDITAASAASSSATGGGAAVSAAYQINVGPATQSAATGWGAGGWGTGTWGVGTASVDALRIWSQQNFGEDLIFGPRYGGMYYFDTSAGVTTRAVNITSMGSASDVPTVQQWIMVSDVSRFVFAFGTNEAGSSTLDPMLIRWSDQESAVNWTPAATNQAGFLRLSHGSTLVTALQVRQEILVWTDSAVYSMQYVGAPVVWGSQILADNISIVSPRAAATASGVTYWMGVDKFYRYDGTVTTMQCDLRKYIYDDINLNESLQIFAGTNEGFNEVWWYYCSDGSTTVDKYVIFNYVEKAWYYGTLGRTAWLDAGSNNNPIAATYLYNIVEHELGVDDDSTGTPAAIEAYITSAEFDIGDGHQFGFVWRILPDMSFEGSTAANPSITMTLQPLKNSGAGYTTPASVAGASAATVTRTVSFPVEEFTGQINVRVRGRQMSMKISSTDLGVSWQMGSPRIDVRPDGRA